MSKILVAYFSATGTTARVAQNLAAAANADIFEIVPATPYTSQDLDYMDRTSRTSLEMDDESCRPEIADTLSNLESYDTIFVGFPVWWYVEPRIIDTFLESYNFSGKTIIPFATSGGSGLGGAPKRMQECAAGSTVLEGRVCNSRNNVEGLKAWINDLGL